MELLAQAQIRLAALVSADADEQLLQAQFALQQCALRVAGLRGPIFGESQRLLHAHPLNPTLPGFATRLARVLTAAGARALHSLETVHPSRDSKHATSRTAHAQLRQCAVGGLTAVLEQWRAALLAGSGLACLLSDPSIADELLSLLRTCGTRHAAFLFDPQLPLGGAWLGAGSSLAQLLDELETRRSLDETKTRHKENGHLSSVTSDPAAIVQLERGVRGAVSALALEWAGYTLQHGLGLDDLSGEGMTGREQCRAWGVLARADPPRALALLCGALEAWAHELNNPAQSQVQLAATSEQAPFSSHVCALAMMEALLDTDPGSGSERHLLALRGSADCSLLTARALLGYAQAETQALERGHGPHPRDPRAVRGLHACAARQLLQTLAAWVASLLLRSEHMQVGSQLAQQAVEALEAKVAASLCLWHAPVLSGPEFCGVAEKAAALLLLLARSRHGWRHNPSSSPLFTGS